MFKRMTVIFSGLIICSTLIIFRLYTLSSTDSLAQAALSQGSYTISITGTRGYIYDRNMVSFVNEVPRYIASVLPSPESNSMLLQAIEAEQKEDVLTLLSRNQPFSVEVSTSSVYARNIQVFTVYSRYSSRQLASHVIGYMDGSYTRGVSGIELAYNDFLTANTDRHQVRYTVDAIGQPLAGAIPEVTSIESTAGVVLTLDAQIQQIAEDAAEGIDKGAVVVMDVRSGELLAVVSKPTFDPNDIAASLEGTDGEFINRPFNGEFNVGSTFKLVDVLAGLKNDVPTDRVYECTGTLDVDGVTFTCENHPGETYLDMHRAIQVSCNIYFIELVLDVGIEDVLSVAESVGFGNSAILAPDMKTSSANLPSLRSISSQADMANLAFGQGALTATPVQIAQLISAIANGGHAVNPTLVLGTSSDGKTVDDSFVTPEPQQAIDTEVANTLAGLLVSAVEEGSGKYANPETGGAGGKTGTAQTGIYDENGVEVLHAWFSGFFPAEDPQYAVVVLVENGQSGALVSAPIFKEIADQINLMNRA